MRSAPRPAQFTTRLGRQLQPLPVRVQDFQHVAAAGPRQALHRAAVGEHRAPRLGPALQPAHQPVGIHDPAVRAEQPSSRAHLRLQRGHLPRPEQPHPLHPIGPGLGGQVLQYGQLLRAGGGHDLARAPAGDALPRAQLVQQRIAAHAQARLPQLAAVVQPGVDHLAVAGGGLPAETVLALHDHQVPGAPGKPLGHRQAHHPGPDDRDAYAVHSSAATGPSTSAPASVTSTSSSMRIPPNERS